MGPTVKTVVQLPSALRLQPRRTMKAKLKSQKAIKAAMKGKFGGKMKAAMKANKKYKRTVLKALRVVALWGRRRVFEQDRWLYILLM